MAARIVSALDVSSIKPWRVRRCGCCLTIATGLASRIGLTQASAHWESSSPYLALHPVLWRVRRTPVAAFPWSCNPSASAHGPKEPRRESANCDSCLVPSLCSVLAAGPAGLGAVADRLATDLALSPSGDHVLRSVRAPARPPVPACPPPWLAAGTHSGGLALNRGPFRSGT